MHSWMRDLTAVLSNSTTTHLRLSTHPKDASLCVTCDRDRKYEQQLRQTWKNANRCFWRDRSKRAVFSHESLSVHECHFCGTVIVFVTHTIFLFVSINMANRPRGYGLTAELHSKVSVSDRMLLRCDIHRFQVFVTQNLDLLLLVMFTRAV